MEGTYGEEGLLLEDDGLDVVHRVDGAHVHVHLHPQQVERQRHVGHLGTTTGMISYLGKGMRGGYSLLPSTICPSCLYSLATHLLAEPGDGGAGGLLAHAAQLPPHAHIDTTLSLHTPLRQATAISPSCRMSGNRTWDQSDTDTLRKWQAVPPVPSAHRRCRSRSLALSSPRPYSDPTLAHERERTDFA
jgi:hypothetical protein